MTALGRPLRRITASANSFAGLWAAIAVVSGLAVARLSPLTTVAVVGGSIVVGAAIWQPAIGLGLALAAGVARAYLAAALPSLPDLGQLFLGLALAGWLARCLAQRRLRLPRLGLFLAFGLYLAASLLSLLANWNVSLGLGLKEIVKWAEMAGIVVLVVAEAQRGRARWILTAVLLAGLAQALIGIWQYQFRGHGPETFLILGNHYRAYGTFEQPNPFGGYVGLVWPLAAALAGSFLAKAWQTRRAGAALAAAAFALAAALMLAALYVSFSRGAWLGAAAAALALMAAWPRRTWLGVALVSLGLALAYGLTVTGLLPASLTARLAQVGDFTTVADVSGINVTADNFAIVERLAHWQAAEGMARDFPWLGVGVGNYEVAYPTYALLNWPNALGHAHMIYLNVLAETGLFGLAAYGILWGAILVLTMRTIGQTQGLARGLALGLLGAWIHLSAHQIVDDLYVNNIPLTIGALLGLLIVVAGASPAPRSTQSDTLELRLTGDYDH